MKIFVSFSKLGLDNKDESNDIQKFMNSKPLLAYCEYISRANNIYRDLNLKNCPNSVGDSFVKKIKSGTGRLMEVVNKDPNTLYYVWLDNMVIFNADIENNKIHTNVLYTLNGRYEKEEEKQFMLEILEVDDQFGDYAKKEISNSFNSSYFSNNIYEDDEYNSNDDNFCYCIINLAAFKPHQPIGFVYPLSFNDNDDNSEE